MYYKDLTDYEYIEKCEAKNVGWLDTKYSYEKGEVSEEFLAGLWKCIRYPVHVCRGFHVCNLCLKENEPPIIKYKNEKREAGYYETVVKGKDGTLYLAPSLIFHYITEHQYKPPQEFIEAVLYTKKLSDKEYREILTATSPNDKYWWKKDSTKI